MRIKLTIEAGGFDNLPDAIHELKEILHELENLNQSELEEELTLFGEHETERMDSVFTISECE